MASIDWAKTTARPDEKHLSFLDVVQLILEIWRYIYMCVCVYLYMYTGTNVAGLSELSN